MGDWEAVEFDARDFDESNGQYTDAPTKLTNFLHNDLGWLIADRHARLLMEESGVGSTDVQWLGVRVKHGGVVIESEYSAANILHLRAAVHPDLSTFVGPSRRPEKIVLRRNVIADVDIFCLLEAPRRVYLSARLKQVLDEARVTGVRWAEQRVAD